MEHRNARLRMQGRWAALLCALVAMIGAFLAGPAVAGASKEQQVQVTAQPALYPGFDSSISDYVIRCNPDVATQVNVTAPAGLKVSVAQQPTRSRTFTASVTRNAGPSFTS